MHKNIPLIGSAQAAKICKVDRATFNRWVVAGEIEPVVKMDGHTGARLFDADEVDALAARKAPTDADEPAAGVA